MFKIGNITFKNNLVLAPMAGITTSAFRSICKQMGCGLVFSEMISDEGVIRNNKRTHDMLKFSDVERPIAIQIFGFNPKRMAIAAKYVETNFKPDIIDINMGCPVNKVANKKHAGAYLIKDPVVTYNIVKSVVDAVKTPVTVKIRSG
jgi:tRNA-dihydrouridine synthase